MDKPKTLSEMPVRVILAGCCVASVVLQACGGGAEAPSDAQAPVLEDVYIAGYRNGASHMNTLPCYWKNGTRVDLDVSDGKAGIASAIRVSGPDVHVAGAVHTLVGSTYHPCLWRNGLRSDLSERDPLPERPAYGYQFATGVDVAGGEIHVSGQTASSAGMVACHWRDGARTDLPGLSDRGSSAAAIQVLDGSVYVAGSSTVAPGVSTPCYWRNGVITPLSLPPGATTGFASVQSPKCL